jgi:hypothetical protein
MPRIQRKSDTPELPEIDTDLSEIITIEFGNGLIAEFKEPTAGDLIAIRKSGVSDEMEATARIACRCCIRWGDKTGVAYQQIEKLGVRDFKRLGQSLNSFLDESESV